MPAKERPTTRIAGSTSKVSDQLTIARTSQNGTMIAVNGRIRPIMAFRSLSGSAVTTASVCTGVERFEAEPEHESAGNRHGSAKARRSFNERAETKSHQEKLQAAVRRDGGDRLLHDFKLAGFDGNVVKKDRGDDDPDNFQQAERAAVQQTGNRQLRRHSKYKNRAKNGRRGPGDGTPVWPHLEAGEQSEQYNDWQRGNQSGEPPVAKRIVHLRPSHHPSSKGSDLAILPAQIRGIANARRLLNSSSLAQPKPFCRASITFLQEES